MVDYRITYYSGRTQIVSAEKFGPAGTNYVFSSDGADVAIIPRDGVESVMLADFPEAEPPEEPEPEPPSRPFGFR